MPITIVHEDITRMQVDAIVNAANPWLARGGGVCGAIFQAAGAHQLEKACQKLAPIHTSQAVSTPGFRLPARYIIHAAGPVFSRANPQESRVLLEATYRNALNEAARLGLSSIAFPLISSGIYGYPKAAALDAARHAIISWLAKAPCDLDVYLTIYPEKSLPINPALARDVDRYIEETQIEPDRFEERVQYLESAPAPAPVDHTKTLFPEPKASPSSFSYEEAKCEGPAFSDYGPTTEELGEGPDHLPPLPDQGYSSPGMSPRMSSPGLSQTYDTDLTASLMTHLSQMEAPFSQALMELIDRKGMSDVEVYRKANLDRRLFSKIRSGKNGYTPRKPTIFALAIALELSLRETQDLLERAGYAISHASRFDVIMEYFIRSGRYDIFTINEVLFYYQLPLLGS